MIPFKRLLTHVKRYKIMLLFGILALVAANLPKVTVPLAIQRSLDALTGRITHSQLLRYSVVVYRARIVTRVDSYLLNRGRFLAQLTPWNGT